MSSSNPEVADDLLTEIFLLLPIKTLIRFQSVSKHWESLIADPKFRHTRNSNLNPPSVALIFPIPNDARGISRTYAHLVPLNKSSPSRKLNFTPTPSSPWDIKLMSSCNGLLVVAVKESYSSLSDYYICNPTTNKYFKLPKTGEKVDFASKTQDWMCLAFDPSKSPHYNVVCVHQLRGTVDQHKLLVYSSKTGSWEKRGKPFTAKVDFEKGAYWNGAVHWCGHEDEIPRSTSSRDRSLFLETVDWVYEIFRDNLIQLVDLPIPLIIDSDFAFCCRVRSKNNQDGSFFVFNIWGSIVRYNVVDKTIELVHKFKVTDIGGHNLVHGRTGSFYRDRGSPGSIFPLLYIESLCDV